MHAKRARAKHRLVYSLLAGERLRDLEALFPPLESSAAGLIIMLTSVSTTRYLRWAGSSSVLFSISGISGISGIFSWAWASPAISLWGPASAAAEWHVII